MDGIVSPDRHRRDALVRARALTHVEALVLRHGPALRWEHIAAGFYYGGGTVHLASRACGIFKPRSDLCLGALSIRTAMPRSGRKRWYVDGVDDAQGVFEYRYEGSGPQSRFNRDLRACLRHRLPLIYFKGIAPARYQPIICVVTADDPFDETFQVGPIISSDREECDVLRAAAIRPLADERRYAIREVRQRLHQGRFREMVLDAYRGRCAICNLGHTRLLDAAHITPDTEPGGQAVLPNGLALCKLHHAAYDGQLLGISPDYEVRIAPPLLAETDGPVLEHGLKGLNASRLTLPVLKVDRPDRDRLERRWSALDWT